MYSADRIFGEIGEASSAPGDDDGSLWEEEPRREAAKASLLPAMDESDRHTMGEFGRGPARGIIVALVPALMFWAVLIILFARAAK